jgi:hypothetical protein
MINLWMTQDEIETLKAANEGRLQLERPITGIVQNRIYQDWLNMFAYIVELEGLLGEEK